MTHPAGDKGEHVAPQGGVHQILTSWISRHAKVCKLYLILKIICLPHDTVSYIFSSDGVIAVFLKIVTPICAGDIFPSTVILLMSTQSDGWGRQLAGAAVCGLLLHDVLCKVSCQGGVAKELEEDDEKQEEEQRLD